MPAICCHSGRRSGICQLFLPPYFFIPLFPYFLFLVFWSFYFAVRETPALFVAFVRAPFVVAYFNPEINLGAIMFCTFSTVPLWGIHGAFLSIAVGFIQLFKKQQIQKGVLTPNIINR
jgi:hypothetical protein